MREIRQVEIRDEMIRLGQLLKLAGVAEDVLERVGRIAVVTRSRPVVAPAGANSRL